ncbi:MAG TPA: hypothetical protein VK203_03360, partial [Nostocaceae cyanobacterium]|nr:hypothetical protein [Nostocaceae cyanobacterium]
DTPLLLPKFILQLCNAENQAVSSQKQPEVQIQTKPARTTQPPKNPQKKTEEQPARLHLHADIEVVQLDLNELNANVGHSWISLEWKNPAAVPKTIPPNHRQLLANRDGKSFADPMGFWPRGMSTEIFNSYVPGEIIHPDRTHQKKVKATQTYDITENQALNVIKYAESKRKAQYSLYFYNCTTFVKEAAEVAGKTPPSMSTVGICYPNALYDGILHNQKNKVGTTTVYSQGKPPKTVVGPEPRPKKVTIKPPRTVVSPQPQPER